MIKKRIVGLAICLLLLSVTNARAELSCSIIAEGEFPTGSAWPCTVYSSPVTVLVPTNETSRTQAAAIQLEPVLCGALNNAADCDFLGEPCSTGTLWSDSLQCLSWWYRPRNIDVGRICLAGYWSIGYSLPANGTWDVVCEYEDDPPAIGAGPYVTSDWQLLPTSVEAPRYIRKNVGFLWTFSDDYASCPGPCTHTAEYQAVVDESWTELTVNTDPTEKEYAYVDVPIDGLTNATTYAFRFAITDCALQATQSETYYFKVDRPDQPPVFLSEPLWFGSWVGLSSDPANPQKPQSQDILFWAQDDDKLACTGATEPSWMYRPVELQEGVVVPLGDWITQEPWRFMMYVWIETLGIVDIVGPGLFEFKMTATDCMGQTIDSEGFWGKRYYFQVD